MSLEDLRDDNFIPPLGSPLLQTDIAVVCTGDERIGELWIGRKEVSCLLEGEDESTNQK